MIRPPVSQPAGNDLRLRHATDGDLPAIAALYGQAYPSPDFNADWIGQRFQHNERFPFPDSVLVAEQQGQMRGMCIVMPLEAFSPGGGIVPMAGISTVAVSPVHRGLGIGSALMRQTLQLAHANQVPIVSCFPFEYRYYGRFGFTPVGRAVTYRFPPQVLPAFPERYDVRLLDEADIAEVQHLHESVHQGRGALTPRRNLVAWRTWWSWYRFQAVGYPARGPLEGVLLYEYKAIPDQRLQHEALVMDFVTRTPEAERGLYGYLAGLGDQVRTVTVTVPEGDPLPLLWTEQRLSDGKSVRRGDFTTGETLIGLMLRISHVPLALAGRSYNGANGSLVLQIEDRDIPANTGPWRVSFTDGEARVTPATGETPDLTCDVATLASLWSGALTVSTAWRWGRVTLTDTEALPLLDDAFRTAAPPFIPDYDTF